MDRKLQRHRADSLRQHGFLVALCDDKKKGKELKGKGRYTMSQDVTFQPFVGPVPIPIKFGVHVAPHEVIKVPNFCNKIFRGFIFTGGQIPRFSQ